MTKEIKLTQGKVALVDDEDYERGNKTKWCAVNMGHTWYAMRQEKRKTIYLHRFIMGAKAGEKLDHINHNGLDCRKNNLRFCTDITNMQNASIRNDNTSGYKGVSKIFKTSKKGKDWRAMIYVNKKQVHLGYFQTPEQAAKVYDKAAIDYFEDFAFTNF